jgi:hypothetical protein
MIGDVPLQLLASECFCLGLANPCLFRECTILYSSVAEVVVGPRGMNSIENLGALSYVFIIFRRPPAPNHLKFSKLPTHNPVSQERTSEVK